MFAANIYNDQRMKMRRFANTICPTSFLKLCMENLDNAFLLVAVNQFTSLEKVFWHMKSRLIWLLAWQLNASLCKISTRQSMRPQTLHYWDYTTNDFNWIWSCYTAHNEGTTPKIDSAAYIISNRSQFYGQRLVFLITTSHTISFTFIVVTQVFQHTKCYRSSIRNCNNYRKERTLVYNIYLK